MKATYINHMGDDLTVVNAARVSFKKTSDWEMKGKEPKYRSSGYAGEPVKNLSDADKGLIGFLARGCTSGEWNSLIEEVTLKGISQAYDDFAINPVTEEECEVYNKELIEILNHIKQMPSHWTPFGHTSITLHLKMPIFVARQILKHQAGFVVNEVSRRYVTDEPEFYVPKEWRKAAENVKQGSSDEVIGTDKYVGSEQHNQFALGYYQDLLDSNICAEQARMVLPQSMYTELWMTGNLYGWANMYNQRTDSHAQKETQELAKQIGEIIEPLFSESWAALTK